MPAGAQSTDDEWIQLFNGENLNGWMPKFTGQPTGENYNDTFTVEDGLLTVAYDDYNEWDGTFGHLFYDEEFSHYILRAEYRFVDDQVSGAPSWAYRNNGLMIHGQTPEEMALDQDFPDSIEVQLLGESEGSDAERTTANVCTPGTDIFMNGGIHNQHCTNSNSDTYRGDQWVTATLVVRGNEAIRHIVEDDGVVLSYTNPQLDNGTPLEDGTISIQSESHPTQFRSIELKPIDPDSPIGTGDPTDTSPIWSSYTKTELASDLDAPMAIDIAPDGHVFFSTRGNVNGGTGTVKMIDPDTTEITTILELDVYISGEDGLQGLVLDPDFEENGWLYLYYSAPFGETDEDPHKKLSRFTVEGDTIDPSSEIEMLRVPAAPDPLAHVGGDLEFGPDGNLYLSVGDDTSPFESGGYTPIDERDGRIGFDAQRSAGNTNDLRGSILRITPQEDGGYTVPDGNLFTGDEYAEARANDLVKTEIYVMGCRNPFRMGIDHETGVLYWGDYGPDSRGWDAERGPPGIVEFNRAAEPGFYGWPYFVGPNLPYIDGEFVDADNSRGYTFESSGEPFDLQNPINESVNNDGLAELPAAQEPVIWYTYSWSALLNSPPEYAQEYLPEEPPYPEFEGGSPMSGPVYNAENYSGDDALVQYFDNKHFIAEWSAGWIRYVSYDDNGEVLDIEPFMPNETFLRPMVMTIGPDGALYLLEWGSGYGAPNNDSGIYQITGGAAAVVSLNLDSSTLGQDESTVATVTVENTSSSELSDVEVSLTSNTDQIEISGTSGTSIDSIAVGEDQPVEFDISAISDASPGSYTLNAEATFTYDGEEEETSASTTVTVFGGEPLERGLEAHFTFDNDMPVNEVTGTDATISGDVTTGAEGIVGNAYEFDINQATDVTFGPNEGEADDGVMTEPLPLNGEGATAGAWINYTEHESYARAPFQIGGSLSNGPANGWDLEFANQSQAIVPQLWNNGNTGVGGGGSAIEVDPETWYFVVMVVNGGDTKIHVFDQENELNSSPQTWTGGSRSRSESEPMSIGVGQGFDMAGRVDELWAYSRALPESEVDQLYTQSLESDSGDGPPAIGDSDSVPTDPDGDGLYEDLNGDGEVTDADAELFFEHIDDPEMQNNVEAFDFNGNGRLDFDDIVEWRKKKNS